MIDPVTVPIEMSEIENRNVKFTIKRVILTKEMISDLLIIGHEFKYALNKYLMIWKWVSENDVKLDGKIRAFTDIIEFNEINPPHEGYNQGYLILCEATEGLENEEYLASLEKNRQNSTKYLESIFDENEVDALVTPCYFTTSNHDLYSYGAFAGYPSITVRRDLQMFIY